jgi:CubicO group peptidase (beta-lactamase class C family)
MKKVLLFFFSIFLLAYSSYGQANKILEVENGLIETREILFADSLVPKFNIYERMQFYKVPSVSIALINNGKIEWAKSYGFADIEGKRPANANTIYQVASISKSVNSLGIMRLVKNGKLSFSEDIRNYLKTWNFPDNEFSKGRTITLKNLLSHTAGLSVHGFVGYSSTDSIPTINQILDGKRPANNEPIKPIFPPGEHFEYSGGGSAVIRKILDDNISNNYDSLMETLVLKPLGMTNSTFSQPLKSNYNNYAFAYDKDMRPLKGNFYIYPEQTAGGLWSTATDIAKFILSIQTSLNDNKTTILDKNTAVEMLTPILDSYALGFGIDEKGGEKYFWHEGESYGYRSIYYGSFTTGKGVVILTNSYPDNGKSLIYEILHSAASAYDWKDFYKPILKKLIIVPDTLLSSYAGEYNCENPELKISIIKTNSTLELTARRSERMYAIGLDTFFIASSPNDYCVFSSSKNNGIIDTFEVIQGTKVVIKAIKRK